ncbi:MAG: PQQ-binding-like beta-propeller repeat protein [Rhodothermales bacterium]|nr:PQQ-binding-like beta-propeller repeat protein [Rhodothermales bacterium]
MRRFLLPLLFLAACDLYAPPEAADRSPRLALSERWAQDLTMDASNGAPVFADGRLFVGYTIYGTGGQLAAYDASTGSLLWNIDKTGSSLTPVVGDGRVFAVHDGVRAFDAATGRRLWSASFAETVYYATPLYSRGALLVSPDLSGEVVALEAATGAVRWKEAYGPAGSTVRGIGEHEGELYVLYTVPSRHSSYEDLTYLAVGDAATGVQRRRSGPYATLSSGFASTTMTFYGPHVFFTVYGQGFDLVAVERATGAEAWRFATSRALDRYGPYRAPDVYNGLLLFGNSGDFQGEQPMKVYALDPSTGNVVWSAAVPRTRDATSQARCGTAFFTQSFSSLDGVDVRSGTYVGNVYRTDFDKKPPLEGYVATAQGTLYYLTRGRVHAAACPDATP